jgi:hypothetical protein
LTRVRLRLLLLVCAAALVAACTETGDHRVDRDTDGTAGTGGSGPAGGPSPARSLDPPPVPPRGAYLGVWINPSGVTADRGSTATATRQVDRMRATVGGLGLLHVYRSWDAPVPDGALVDIVEAGAVPLLDWGCGSDHAIAEGREDEHIRSYALALRRFGRPVFLRYSWEMNLRSRERARCEGQGGPHGFVAAWRRIRQIFAEVGATNVAFVWCPAVERPGQWRAYYPGADAVDWIAVDGYARDPDPAAATDAFAGIFSGFYDQFLAEGKPMMIAETGALGAGQAAYLSSLATLLPSTFPQIKALAYFDAEGPRGDWSLDGDGLRAFADLAADPYFSFRA